MKYTHFTIRNFKGIEHVQLNLEKAPKSRVHTLVGLNESGKTTVLEAIDRLSYRESLDALKPQGYARADVHDLIPIAKRANFNDEISIEAGVAMDPADQVTIRKLASKQHSIALTEDIKPFTIRQRYKFTASKIDATQPPPEWGLVAKGRVAIGKRPTILTGDQWQQIVNLIKTLLPRIVYFQNFLFEFPDQIYLENPPDEVEKHAFYKGVLQDVLDAVGDGTTLDQHVLARAKSADEHDKKSLQSVLLRMSAHITNTVFSNWDRIFKRPPGKKEIAVTIERDQRGVYYLKLQLKEGSEYYEISERSLGFRWFFSYLLLTQYRGFRQQGPHDVVFLLDEPASNLHPSAQAQLLDSFQSLPEGCSVIYTTHSHHLIRPEWLDGAYVVKNEGLQYGDDDNQYTSRRTLITVTRYREFAVKHPNQTTYFQPILDVLDYRPTLLDNVPDVVMLEGKTDFYAIRYVALVMGTGSDIRLIPGSGAGSLDSVMRLYLGWGRNFIAVLDSDKTGLSEKQRYRDVFGPVVEGRVLVLSDLNPVWNNMEIEDLFDPDDRMTIQKVAYPEANEYHKTHFARALQELVSRRRLVNLNPGTISKFQDLIATLTDRLTQAATL